MQTTIYDSDRVNNLNLAEVIHHFKIFQEAQKLQFML